MRNTFRSLVFLLALSVPGITESVNPRIPGTADLGHGARAVLWRDPADIASRNLLYGSGGKEHQPSGPFTFLSEDMQGSNPKFDIRDRDGVKWKVKLGAEARPEVVASRLVWAAGYFTPEDYFLADLHVEGLPAHLHRGQSLVGADGTLHNVRLKRSLKGEEKIATWKWSSNPFRGTREFNGLRTLMALINDWDLKDSNNRIFEEKPTPGSVNIERIYMVSDLGASFGTPGFKLSTEESRGNLEAYQRSKLITSLSSTEVNFEAPGRPAPVESLNLPVYMHRVDMRWIGHHLPRSDAKWLGQLLSRLSADQLADAFRAADYSPEETSAFVAVVQGRIAELSNL